MPRVKLWSVMSLALAFAFGGPLGCERGDHPSNIGRPAPLFAVSDGVQSVDLSKLRGRRSF